MLFANLPLVKYDIPSFADYSGLLAMRGDEGTVHLRPHRFNFCANFHSAFLHCLEIRLYTPGFHSHSSRT